MVYDTIDKVYDQLAAYARKPEGVSIRRFLVHCPKERLQVIADLAPDSEEAFQQSMAKLGLFFV